MYGTKYSSNTGKRFYDYCIILLYPRTKTGKDLGFCTVMLPLQKIQSLPLQGKGDKEAHLGLVQLKLFPCILFIILICICYLGK